MFIYPIHNHNWRNISTIYIYITRLASNKIFSQNKIHRKVGQAKDLSAPLYRGNDVSLSYKIHIISMVYKEFYCMWHRHDSFLWKLVIGVWKKNHTSSFVYLIRDIQDDSKGKVHNLGSDFICYYKKKAYERVANSEWSSRKSCLYIAI
jgi:hypothetical protein